MHGTLEDLCFLLVRAEGLKAGESLALILVVRWWSAGNGVSVKA
jgi:hypothetical protein